MERWAAYLEDLRRAKASGAATANAEDARVWRWLSPLIEERRIRWTLANGKWLVSVDNRHVATHQNFDCAIRIAIEAVEKCVRKGRAM